jgi:hypothetical protein
MALLAYQLLFLCWIAIGMIWGDVPFTPSIIGPLFTPVAAFVALFVWGKNRDRDESEDYLDSARDLMAKAYGTLNVTADVDQPGDRRLRWLTAARLNCAAIEVATAISEPSHLRIWTDELNYWRGRFYDLIHPILDGAEGDYFAERPEHWVDGHAGDERGPIDPRSLAVFYRFIQWPEDRADPLSDVPDFSDEEVRRMQLFRARSLGGLLARARAIRRQRG